MMMSSSLENQQEQDEEIETPSLSPLTTSWWINVDKTKYIVYIWLLIIVVYFGLRYTLYRTNSDFRENPIYPIYFILVYTGVVFLTMIGFNLGTTTIIAATNWKKIFLSSFGCSILFLTSCFASLQLYPYLSLFPFPGSFLASILRRIEGYLGPNASRVLLSWWGCGITPLLAFIPIVGPLLSALTIIIPQHLLLFWLGYLLVKSGL